MGRLIAAPSALMVIKGSGESMTGGRRTCPVPRAGRQDLRRFPRSEDGIPDRLREMVAQA